MAEQLFTGFVMGGWLLYSLEEGEQLFYGLGKGEHLLLMDVFSSLEVCFLMAFRCLLGCPVVTYYVK